MMNSFVPVKIKPKPPLLKPKPGFVERSNKFRFYNLNAILRNSALNKPKLMPRVGLAKPKHKFYKFNPKLLKHNPKLLKPKHNLSKQKLISNRLGGMKKKLNGFLIR